MTRRGLIGWIVLTSLLLVVGSAVAKEYNFETHARKEGCASIVFPDRRSDCMSRQKAKNETCKKRLTCDLDKATRLIRDLKDKKSKLKSANDADKDAIKRKIKELKDQLDVLKATGSRGVPLAEKCVQARSKMKSMFKRTIPLTKDAGSNAKRKRSKLLDQLKDAKKKAEEAKREKDKAEKGDDGPKRKWEDAQKEVRRLEKELERFNKANGKDIQRNVDRLIRHYEEGHKRHEKPERDDQTHLQKCKSLSRISY